jgi:hypothetical protein
MADSADDQTLEPDFQLDNETDDLDEIGWWPTPAGIVERAADVRGEWSEGERAKRCAGTTALPGRADLCAERARFSQPTPEQVTEIETSILAAGRAIRRLRPQLADGVEAYSAFIDGLELSMRCPVNVLIELARFADRRDSVERMFRALFSTNPATPHHVSSYSGE